MLLLDPGLAAQDKNPSPHDNIHFRKLGTTSGGWSLIINSAEWSLDRLGAAIAIHGQLVKLGSALFTPGHADSFDISIQRQYTSAKAGDSDADVKKKTTEYISQLSPIFRKHTALAAELGERYESFTRNVQATATLENGSSLKNYLAALYRKQVSHLGLITDVKSADTALKSRFPLLKDGLTPEHLRFSIDSHELQRKAHSERMAQGIRSHNFLRFHQGKEIIFTDTTSVDVCTHGLTELCHSPNTTPASSGKKKRSLFGSTAEWKKSLFTTLNITMPATSPPVSRQKRFINFAMALVGLISSIGFASYSASEISYLHRQLSNQQATIRKLATSQSLTNARVDIIDKKVDEVAKVVIQICRLNNLLKFDAQARQFDSLLTLLYIDLSTSLLHNELGYASLRKREFPYQIISPSELDNLYMSVTDLARRNKLVAYLDSPEALYNSETIVSLVDGKPQIVSLIAARSDESPELMVLEYVDRPLLVGNLTIRFHPEKPYIITNTDYSYYKELSYSEFQDCQLFLYKSENMYWCRKSNAVYRKDTAGSCAMKLITAQYSNLHKTCPSSIGHITDYAGQLDRTHFQLYSNSPDTVSVRCTDLREHHSTPFQFFKEVEIAPGCVGESSSHIFYSAWNTLYHKAVPIIRKSVDIQDFFAALSDTRFEDSLSALEQHIHDLEETQKKKVIDLEVAKHVIETAQQASNGSFIWVHYKAELFIGLSVLVALGFYTAVLVRRCVKRRRLQQPEPVLGQGQELVPLGPGLYT